MVVEGVNLMVILEVISKYGTLGVLIIVWWTDRKQLREQNDQHKKDINAVLDRYKEDMVEQRKMYDGNVKLVKAYETVSSDLKEVVMMNTQAVTQLCVDVQTNQFCPNVRLEKQAKGVVG
jgi:hypothetical protein